MPASKLRRFLDEQGVRYVMIGHSPAFTAQEIAASAHVPGKLLAKTVMIRLDGELALAVLPASERIDFRVLQNATGARRVELASEQEFRGRFPDCEVGTMPPFGNLYGMHTYVSEELAEDEEIAFNAGAHTELIRLSYRDYERIVRPRRLAFVAPQFA